MNVADHPIFGMSVCSGVDGIGLGLAIALPGYRTVVAVEREGYPAALLAARAQDGSIPEIAHWDDVATFDGRPWRGAIDILHAGIPCQPWSVAGKRGGIEDERWIWPDVARIVREVEPAVVFLENVRGFIRGGLGLVIRNLADLGYVGTYDIFSAAECGAPHRRERVFVLAYRDGERRQQVPGSSSPDEAADGRARRDARQPDGDNQPASDGEGLADAACRGLGMLREPSGCAGQPDRSHAGLAHAERPRCDGSEGQGLRVDGPSLLAARSSGDGRDVADAGCAGERRPAQSAGFNRRGTPDDDCRAGRALADPRDGQLPQPWRGPGRRDGAGSAGSILEDPTRHGEQGCQRQDGRGRRRGIREADESVPLFPPGPSDRDAWQAILAQRPDLAPAIEPPVRGMASGPAARVDNFRTDRLRSLGNLVVPMQAALAFTVLARRVDLA